MKYHLRRIIRDATLTYEEMTTLLTQIEACFNSRPILSLSDDLEDLNTLTPDHFLIGFALNVIPEPSIAEEPLTRWQMLQLMKDHFWHRWVKEYLHILAEMIQNQPRSLCRKALFGAERTAPTKWPLARIIKLYPGTDGHARVVEIRTANNTFKRPVTKLIFLPGDDESTLTRPGHSQKIN